MIDRRPTSEVDEQEVTGLAGWLYTDLLLGLAVVFLGAITFTVTRPASAEGDGEMGPAASSTSTTSTTTTTTLPEPCTVLRPPDDTAGYRLELETKLTPEALLGEIQQQLTKIREANGVATDSGVAFALVFGGGATNADGKRNARQFWEDRLLVDEVTRDIFGTTVPRFFHDTSLGRGQVNVDVFLQVGSCN